MKKSQYDDWTNDELVAEYKRLGKAINKRCPECHGATMDSRPIQVTVTIQEEPDDSPASQAGNLLGSMFMGLFDAMMLFVSLIVWGIILCVIYAFIFD